MAIRIEKSDADHKTIADKSKAVVRKQNDEAASKTKAEASSPSVSARPAPYLLDEKFEEFFAKLAQKHKERLAYNAAYQRDLRTIKRLGLNCSVAEFRKAKEK